MLPGKTDDLSEKEFFHSLPPEVDPGEIIDAWKALRPFYNIDTRCPPVPAWARRPYSDSAESSWRMIQRGLAECDLTRGICLYLHIPFCAQKCAFCDCYSFRLRSHVDEHVEKYTRALAEEAALWGGFERLVQRPVSTVHFGGGTPLFIGEDPFRRLVSAVRQSFPNSVGSEWALETTSSDLTPDRVKMLQELNFTRIHIGVQSLDDPVRGLLARREGGQTVIEKIAQLVDAGNIVSVDLIYGLPQQTLASLLDDIRRLADCGVDGFSLYPLQISPHNRGILKLYGSAGKRLLHEFWMLQAAEQVLARLGYRKTLFNHYARLRDANLYFTFPERGEDCLALGTIADGVFGSYHYRHLEYRDYLDHANHQPAAAFPALQGGLQRSNVEIQRFPLEVAILSGRVNHDHFAAVLGQVKAQSLFESWLENRLIWPNVTDACAYQLTASGSWFAGVMLGQLYTWAGQRL